MLEKKRIRWFSLTEFKARVDTHFARTRMHQHKQDTRYKIQNDRLAHKF